MKPKNLQFKPSAKENGEKRSLKTFFHIFLRPAPSFAEVLPVFGDDEQYVLNLVKHMGAI